MHGNHLKLVLTLLLIPLFAGCANMINQKIATNLAHGIQNQNDPEIVRVGAPAYLLMVDGFIEEEPEEVSTLIAGAKLYTVYAAVFVDEPQRAKGMSDKALRYARRASCAAKPDVCGMDSLPFDEFAIKLGAFDESEIDTLYTYATAWVLWISLHSDDWNAVADLSRARAMLQQVLLLDERYDKGQPHLYLGVMDTLLPPAMGGKPEEGRGHFERAIELSHGANLMAKVEYARGYARLLFDRELHDRLLTEVVKANPIVKGYTLSNTLAQEEARKLLASSEEYFGE